MPKPTSSTRPPDHTKNPVSHARLGLGSCLEEGAQGQGLCGEKCLPQGREGTSRAEAEGGLEHSRPEREQHGLWPGTCGQPI